MIDVYRGQIRIRKWPRKRGTPKSQQVRDQNDWFRFANNAAKNSPAVMQIDAMEAVVGTGLYPRDWITKALGTGLIDILEPDGTIVRYEQKRIDTVSWQGFIIRPSVDFAIPTNVFFAPSWPVPVRDTGGFFSAASPTLITIPEGVEIMEFTAGAFQRVAVAGHLFSRIVKNDTLEFAYQGESFTGQKTDTVSTGPMLVEPGDTIKAEFNMSGNGELSGNGATFFSGTVLQATF